MKNIIIPNKATKYILFQRTAYLKIPKTRLYRIFKKMNILPNSFYNKVVCFEALFFAESIKKMYLDDMEQEYNTIKDYLPINCNNILDIGCGIAGIDLFLKNHYKNSVEFSLLDKNEVNETVYYDLNKKAAFYNSLDLAKDFLSKNGIDETKISLLFANDKNEINTFKEFDLVISLISWGFHYPVEIYLNRVYELLNTNGILIIDIRKGNDGLELIKNKFSSTEIILDANKYFRVKAIK